MYVHWFRSISGTPRSLKELVTEEVLTTGTFILQQFFCDGFYQIAYQDGHLDAGGPGWGGDYCGGGD